MKDIKFRAWNTVIGWWADKEPVTLNQLILNDSKGISEKALNEDFTFMQFTGLTDKNGVEIYEGDIVKPLSKGWCGDFLTGVITYKGGSFAPESKGISWSFNGINCEYHEVIGNIHENPELLGEE